MTEAERAILRNQLVIMQMSMINASNDCVEGSWSFRVQGDVARRITSTQLALYDPSTMCKCTGRGKHVHTISTSDGGKFVCDWCDREIQRVRHEQA